LLAVYATFSVSEFGIFFMILAVVYDLVLKWKIKKIKKVDPDELVPEISFVVPHHLGVSQ
jgi:hypothetical protein